MNKIYKQQVELLLKIIPTITDIESFAIHGGTAINLYVLDLPRYSIDIDVTYTPIKPREESFAEIHNNLTIIKERVKSIIPDVVVSEKPNKIYCSQRGVMVKVEVSGTKRGLIEPYEIKSLCSKAQHIFETTNKAKIVSISQLYGGKITAAFDRQHPRDIFDIKLMFDFVTNFEQVKKGFFYCLLGGDRPILESLSPNRIDQRETLVKQFAGMTEMPFSYNDYEDTREKLIDFVNSNLTKQDKEFLIAFEAGKDLFDFADYQEYLQFPSVQWKLQNINKFKDLNPVKHSEYVKKLENYLANVVR
jgi:predicted nucleotidyltransferase component of viral defense system